MTIKQQGGIFGRNPTFNDVTIDGTLTVDTNVLVVDKTSNKVGIQTLSPAYDLDVPTVGHNSTGEILITGGNAASNDYTQAALLRLRATSINPNAPTHIDAASVAEIRLNHTNLAGNASSGYISFLTNPSNNANPTIEAMRIDASQNVKVSAGNLIIGTSGKGIDFSATAGTGTSELFDDYEEGTWTPTYTTDGTDFDSITYDAVTSGNYTKIGNLVTLVARIRTDAITVGSASGSLVVGGLPFTPSANFGSASVYASSFAASEPRVLTPATAGILYLYKRTAADGADTTMTASEAGTGSNQNTMYFTVSYQTA
jgi:hypothetical protein